jgi:hypothetical protein
MNSRHTLTRYSAAIAAFLTSFLTQPSAACSDAGASPLWMTGAT